MADLDSYNYMLWVEAGHVTSSVQLGAGDRFQAYQILSVTD